MSKSKVKYHRLRVSEVKPTPGRVNLYTEFNSKHKVRCKRHGGTVVLVNCKLCDACCGLGQKQVWCTWSI